MVSCGGGYEVTFINGIDTKAEIYLHRDPPKRPLKFADAEPKKSITMSGPKPTLENKKVAIFNGKDKLLYTQVVTYPQKNERYQDKTWLGNYRMYMLITDRQIKQMTLKEVDEFYNNE